MEELPLMLVGSSFLAGMLMFFAPCTFPLIPAFLAILTGNHKGFGVVTRALVFCLGFSLVFISLGLFSGYLGQNLYWLQLLFSKISGLVIIVLGLFMLGFGNQSLFAGMSSFPLPKFIKPGTHHSAFLLGLAFSLSWSPCIGPIMATILLLATSEGTLFAGGVLLAVFSLGLTTPFVLAAIFYNKIVPLFTKYASITKAFSVIFGFSLLILGVFLLLSDMSALTGFGLRVFDWLNINWINTRL